MKCASPPWWNVRDSQGIYYKFEECHCQEGDDIVKFKTIKIYSRKFP